MSPMWFTGNGRLNYAHFNGVTWTTSTVDANGVGVYPCSIAVDAAGHPGISYMDGVSTNGVDYASYNGTSWTLTSVDSTFFIAKSKCQWLLTGRGKPSIVYGGTIGVRLAQWNGSSWSLSTVDAGGFDPTTIVMDGNGRPQSCWHNNGVVTALQYALNIRDQAGPSQRWRSNANYNISHREYALALDGSRQSDDYLYRRHMAPQICRLQWNKLVDFNDRL